MTAFNSLDDHGRVTTVLLSFQHAFEMLLKAALEAKKVPCLRQAQREVDFVGDSRGQEGIDDLSSPLVSLLGHVQSPLPRHDERPKCAADRVETGWHDDAGHEQVVAALGLIDEDVPAHARRV